jgi:hypothetical protein
VLSNHVTTLFLSRTQKKVELLFPLKFYPIPDNLPFYTFPLAHTLIHLTLSRPLPLSLNSLSTLLLYTLYHSCYSTSLYLSLPPSYSYCINFYIFYYTPTQSSLLILTLPLTHAYTRTHLLFLLCPIIRSLEKLYVPTFQLPPSFSFTALLANDLHIRAFTDQAYQHTSSLSVYTTDCRILILRLTHHSFLVSATSLILLPSSPRDMIVFLI